MKDTALARIANHGLINICIGSGEATQDNAHHCWKLSYNIMVKFENTCLKWIFDRF